MAGTPLELVVDRDELTVQDLSELAAALAGYLAALDEARSGRATLDFHLETVSYSSPLLIRAGLQPREDVADNGPAIAALSIRGIDWIETERVRPSDFPDVALENLRRLAGFTADGVPASMTLRAPTLQLATPVTPSLAAHVETVLRQGDSIGAIEGSLETVSVHRNPYFTVYDALSLKGVRCYFPDEWRARVVGLLDKRVMVHGRLRREPGGAPKEMRDLDELVELGITDGSPDGLAGVFAGLDVQVYLRDIHR